jgi:nanoRNase/pAp phosphatase (c-di-AMP/oligoRNAs hydrolase)
MGISHVGSYEADVASALIKIGFDVGIVWSKKTSEYRISTRASNKICSKTGLHLGKILEELSDDSKGSGGGHDGAASLKGKIGLENILKIIEEKILITLKK